MQADGTVTDGVLSIDAERDDIGDATGPLGVTFVLAREIRRGLDLTDSD